MDKKLKEYRHLNNDYYVVPVAIEMLLESMNLMPQISSRILVVGSKSEKRGISSLMQAIGIAIQRNEETASANGFKL